MAKKRAKRTASATDSASNKAKTSAKASVKPYRHRQASRKNNPPAAIAAEGETPLAAKVSYAYSPRLSPALRSDPAAEVEQLLEHAGDRPLTRDEVENLRAALVQHEPWLEWAGKQEAHRREVFEVDPVALQIHERLSTQAILKVAARQDVQRSLFADPQLDYHEAVRFYQHDVAWSNRLILGDSLQVMSSLGKREDLAGKVQMIYLDPPYGIKFASNFQPEVGKRDVKDKESDLTREPEMVRAYRDTWHLGIHSYLSYLRDRLIVARELLADTGSIFVQISDENVHRVRQLMDEVFGRENFVNQIVFQKTSSSSSTELSAVFDYLLWYGKREKIKYYPLYFSKASGEAGATQYNLGQARSGQRDTISNWASRDVSPEKLNVFAHDNITSQRPKQGSDVQDFDYEGRTYEPKKGTFKTDITGLRRLAHAKRMIFIGDTLRYVRYLNDFAIFPQSNLWTDTTTSGFADEKRYVVQTNVQVIKRCMLMTTDPGDLVLDPTCGSGTTAYVAEQWGRRWITIDTSRVAVSLARQRLLTGRFEMFRLREGESGSGGEGGMSNGRCCDPSSGFIYKTVPHITLGSIARNQNLDPIFEKHEPILEEKLAACNAALGDVMKELRDTLSAKLIAKQKNEGKRAITDADRRRWTLPLGKQNDASQKKVSPSPPPPVSPSHFEHWTVPFDTDPDWPKSLQQAVTEYRKAWRAKMDEVNACIDANAEQEELVDQPEKVSGIVRVSGPFTVEAVQPPEMSLGDVTSSGENAGMFDGEPEDLEGHFEVRTVEPRPQYDAQNVDAYLDGMFQRLRGDGVRFPDNRQMVFSRLDRVESGVPGLHAEGRWKPEGETDDDPEGPATVAVAFGPQYGPVTAKMVISARQAAMRIGYDDLVIAGFSFDGPAQTEIEKLANMKPRVHLANIRPDVNPAMNGLLKEQPGSQLFTVFGQPRSHIEETPDGEYRAIMEGVDIYDPVKNEVRSTGADKVAAWFLDADYDERTFCVSQAFFPDRSAWDKLKKALKGVVEEEAFEAFAGTESLPFPAGEHGRAAVKVIDPRGNEVMQVHSLGG